MTTTDVVCPSGLSGVIRPMRGKDLEIVTDERLIREGRVLDRLLASCWTETHDLGPYKAGKDGHPDWAKVLVGDRSFIATRLRAVTYGPLFRFEYKCPECSNRTAWDFDLDGELGVTPLADEDKAAFMAGQPIEETLPTQPPTRFAFRLPVGEDERHTGKLLEQHRGNIATAQLAAICSRIVSIEGCVDKMGQPGQYIHRFKWFQEQAAGLAPAAGRIMSRHDCGITTSIEIPCGECGSESKIQIPFGGLLLPPLEQESAPATDPAAGT